MFGRKKRNKKKVLSKEELQAKFDDVEFEDNDLKALTIAALITFIPALLLIVGIFVFFIWIFYLR